jgi:hypothetical protein
MPDPEAVRSRNISEVERPIPVSWWGGRFRVWLLSHLDLIALSCRQWRTDRRSANPSAPRPGAAVGRVIYDGTDIDADLGDRT